MRNIIYSLLFFISYYPCTAQYSKFKEDDSDYIKIKHVSPVFDDLTTDLGARRGENEANMNFGYRRLRENHHVFLTQLEYEIAPINNLGIEMLLPYTVYLNNQLDERERPGNRMEFFQWGTQFTFYKSDKRKTSAALGLRNILETQDPMQNNDDFSLATIVYNPFLTLAKNWNEKYFFIISGGVEILRDVELQQFETSYPVTTAFHYNFSDNDHFVGIEFNKDFDDGEFEMFIRPQVILGAFDDFNVGATLGIPVGMPDIKWTAFLRLAYEFH